MTIVRSLLSAGTLLAGVASLPAAAQSNPTEAQNQAARAAKSDCDPWITIAYKRVYGDGFVPATWMCDKRLYVGGRWTSFAELQGAVRTKDYGLSRYSGVTIGGSGPLAGRTAVGVFSGNTLTAAAGPNLLAALVAAGGGNLVAAGGGNLVAAGGGNLISLDQNQLFSPGPRTLLSTGSRQVPVKD